MCSYNGKDYEQKYGNNHERAANEYQADKIYIYKALRGKNLPITYKLISSEEEEKKFLDSPNILDPQLIWSRR